MASLLQFRVSPNARRTEVCGRHGPALRVKLAAPPVDGRANDVLLDHVAGTLGLPRRAVTLERGASSRDKWVRIEGMSAEDALSRLEQADAR